LDNITSTRKTNEEEEVKKRRKKEGRKEKTKQHKLTPPMSQFFLLFLRLAEPSVRRSVWHSHAYFHPAQRHWAISFFSSSFISSFLSLLARQNFQT
jgi:hypothetical protein